jgi:hypothetical protein
MDQKQIRNYVAGSLSGLKHGPTTSIEEAFTLAWYAQRLDRKRQHSKKKQVRS